MYQLQNMPQEAEFTLCRGSVRRSNVCIFELLHAMRRNHPLRSLFRKDLCIGWVSITPLHQCASLHEYVSLVPLGVALFPQRARAHPAERDRGDRPLSRVEDELLRRAYEAQGPGRNRDVCGISSARQAFAVGTMAEELWQSEW